MNFQDLPGMLEEMTRAFGQQFALKACPLGTQAFLRWPKLLPVMQFSVHQYEACGYGNIFGMNTVALGGLMKLATFVCTPNTGIEVPLLLVDVMAMGKKRAVFVEYYDCTASGASMPLLEQTATRYVELPDYAEKPAWYVSERTPYSLIKGGTQEERLCSMLSDTIGAYVQECALHTQQAPENLKKLQAFADRMVQDGNPSSATLERVLGKTGAETFFRNHIMPCTFKTN